MPTLFQKFQERKRLVRLPIARLELELTCRRLQSVRKRKDSEMRESHLVNVADRLAGEIMRLTN